MQLKYLKKDDIFYVANDTSKIIYRVVGHRDNYTHVVFNRGDIGDYDMKEYYRSDVEVVALKEDPNQK
jgi:hypothetical protein